MGCSNHKSVDVEPDTKKNPESNKENIDQNQIQKENEVKEQERKEKELKEQKDKEEKERKEKEDQERKEKELKEQKEREEKERKEREEKERIEREEKDRIEREEKERKEKEEQERKEKEEQARKEKEEQARKEKEEQERKEKEEKERKEKEEKEKEEKDKNESTTKDEETGNEVESHNDKIPSDPGHYLAVPLGVKKNKIFVPSKSDLERFQRDGLKRHNYYRKYHKSGPMELTQKLNDFAQKYAETLAAKNTMQHSTHEQREKIYGDWTGENLYYFWTSESDVEINGAAAVDSWYDEIKDYDFVKGGSKNGGVVGHFTQLVWKGSTQLGMGVAKSSQNSVFVVANYHFGGNFNNDYLNNVFPAEESADNVKKPDPKKEAAKKEEEENNKKIEELTKDDESSGSEVKSHNSKIPSDPGHYLEVSLGVKKDKVFVPNQSDLERFQRDGLKRHNYYRKYHQSGPMVLTKVLNDYAQKYAETLAAKNTMQHSSDKDRKKLYGDWTGENLYYFWTSASGVTLNGAAAVDSWYDEIKDYDFKNGKSKGGVVGHFTQLVWKGSTQLGIGVARSSQNSVFVVANYHFGGNFNNDYLNNVFPAKA